MSLRVYYLVVIFIISFINVALGQMQMLKVLMPGVTDDTTVNAQYVAGSMGATAGRNPDVGNNFQNADRICVWGIWALYSTTNYGRGQESITTVITVVGKVSTKLECSNSNQIAGLKNVKSVRFLGNADGSMPGVSILSDAFLLGGLWEVTASTTLMNPDAVRLGSFAITGAPGTPPVNQWQFCADANCIYQICVDVSRSRFAGTFFLSRDTVRDTSNKWPLVVNQANNIMSKSQCAGMPNPAYARSLWRNDNSTVYEQESNLDIHVYNPSEYFQKAKVE